MASWKLPPAAIAKLAAIACLLTVTIGCVTPSGVLTSASTCVECIEVPSTLSSVAVGRDAVWLKGTDRVYKIDPRRREIVATIPVGKGIVGYQELAVDRDSVWVLNSAENTVIRLDPDTHQVVARLPVGKVPKVMVATIRSQRIWLGAGSVWILNHAAGTLTRIDTVTNKVVATIAVGKLWDRTPFGWVLIADDEVFVLDANWTLSRLDLQTNSIAASVQIKKGPFDIADGAIWSLGLERPVLSRFDAQTLELEDEFHLDPDFDGTFRYGGGSIWLLNTRTATLSLLDPNDNRVTESMSMAEHLSPPKKAASAVGAVVRNDAIWVFYDENMSKVDLDTRQVLATIRVGPWWQGYDFGEDFLWVMIFRTNAQPRGYLVPIKLP